jgi:hypothetical protein
MISSGRTRFNANHLKASSSVDALGRRSTLLTSTGNFRCDVREGPPVEQTYADGVATVQSYELRTRWPNIARLNMTALDRVTVRGRTLRINGIRNLDQADRVAVIDCTEVA